MTRNLLHATMYGVKIELNPCYVGPLDIYFFIDMWLNHILSMMARYSMDTVGTVDMPWIQQGCRFYTIHTYFEVSVHHSILRNLSKV